MSERKARFRIRKGEIEIEYEGSPDDVNSRYKEAFEWIKTATVALPPETRAAKKREKKIEKSEEKAEKRGGSRTAVIGPAIDELIKEGFLDDFKNAHHILEELRRKTVPVSGLPPVRNALNRRVPKTLDRIKDKEGKWVYRKKT